MILLTYGIAFNFFGGQNDVGFHVVGACLVSHVARLTHVSSPGKLDCCVCVNCSALFRLAEMDYRKDS